MFPKSMSVFTLEPGTDLSTLADKLAANRFTPCTDLQEANSGWSAPTEEGALVHAVEQFRLLRFTAERKTIPASAFKAQLATRCAELAKQQGFKVGRKQKKELAEALRDELLPRQLAARKDVMVVIDTLKGRVIIDSTVPGVVDDITRSFLKHGEIALRDALVFGKRLTAAARDGLDGELDAFGLSDRASVEFPGELKPQIAYRKCDLYGSRLAHNIESGAAVLELGLQTDNLSFVLSHLGFVKGIKLFDVLRQGAKDAADFDAGVVLAGLEMRKLINDLQQLEEDLQK